MMMIPTYGLITLVNEKFISPSHHIPINVPKQAKMIDDFLVTIYR